MVETEIIELRPSKSRPGHGIIRLRNVTTNQRGEVVQTMLASAMVPRRCVAGHTKNHRSGVEQTRKLMDNIPKRADDEAWDKKANRRISDINQSIEKGLSGEALATLHGLHIAPNDNLPYDVDERTEVDDQETLRDKIISRTDTDWRFDFAQSQSTG